MQAGTINKLFLRVLSRSALLHDVCNRADRDNIKLMRAPEYLVDND